MASNDAPMRFCGRTFTQEEIDLIRGLMAREPQLNRAQLSRRVCEALGWRRPGGGLKDMSCRVAMLRMEKDGFLELPPPQNGNGNGAIRPRLTEASAPQPPVTVPAGHLGKLHLLRVTTPQQSSLWNEVIERYHYLGYQPLPGAQLRYLIFSAHSQLLAALGFGAAAWKVAPRDRFIGWSPHQRTQHLHRVVNNARFLILPWVNSKNLASKILALTANQLPNDWHAQYQYAPVLLETFVERNRFAGTSYRAANWIHVGQTQGRGKLDRYHQNAVPQKDIYLYPLHQHFRQILTDQG
ncbi:MAG: DUF4338 domain-containing protein [Planctomycetota bacterium]|jgi:hypothetical protein